MTIETKYNVGDEVWWFGRYKSKIEAVFTTTTGKDTTEHYRITDNVCDIEPENLYREKQEIPYLLNSYKNDK